VSFRGSGLRGRSDYGTGRLVADNSLERAEYERTWKVPLVVLVDNNSASASEIFAAAIQENNRGLVVGRKSYGKGTVQTHFPLESVSGSLKLTTARFYSPKDRMMAGSGVTPDITVTLADSDTEYSESDDPDIQRAIAVTENRRLEELAMSHLGCRTGIHHDFRNGKTDVPVTPRERAWMRCHRLQRLSVSADCGAGAATTAPAAAGSFSISLPLDTSLSNVKRNRRTEKSPWKS